MAADVVATGDQDTTVREQGRGVVLAVVVIGPALLNVPVWGRRARPS